jgi:serine/threonine protein phosphatase 1
VASLGKAIAPPVGNRIVIPDIHGCFYTLEALLKDVHPSPQKDQLIFLGDYVNKGPRSKEVLDFLISLKKSQPNTIFIKGNHDEKVENFLKQPSESGALELKELKAEAFFDLSPVEKKKYLDFFQQCVFYLITGNFILVHAGFNFSLANPFLDQESMTNIKGFSYDAKKAHNKTIVHGHLPTSLMEIEIALEDQERILPLDNGCVYPDRVGMGNLLALNLETREFLSEKFKD